MSPSTFSCVFFRIWNGVEYPTFEAVTAAIEGRDAELEAKEPEVKEETTPKVGALKKKGCC